MKQGLVGRKVGIYELEAMLGRGGMGSVYRTIHPTLEQPRAIKILPPHLANEEGFVERFRREATIVARLNHPNIVQIYDVGEQDDLHYIVMELVEGRSLREVIKTDSPLSMERAARLLNQLAAAIDYAHAHGVLHRDIKPANVLVGEDDHVTLVDFGIARAAASEARLTRTGLMVGTPEYMAPELVTGTGGNESADLYALGIVAYELLTGHVPFSGGDTPALIFAHVHKPPPSPLTFRADLNSTVERALLRQLSKDPAQRFPTGVDFVRAMFATNGQAGALLDSEPPLTLGGEATALRTQVRWGYEVPPEPGPGVAAPGVTANGARTVGATTLTPPPGVDTQARPLSVGVGEAGREAVTPAPLVRAPARRGPFAWLLGPAIVAIAVVGVAAFVLIQLDLVGGRATSTPTPVVNATAESQRAPTVAPPTVAIAGPPTTAPATAAPPTPAPPTAPPATATSVPPTATPGPQQRLQGAMAALAAGDFPRAIELLTALKRSDPGTPGLDDALYQAHLGYGMALFQSGAFDAAWGQYGEALKIRPNDQAALDGQKQIILQKNWNTMEAAWGKDEDAAIAALEEIMILDPNYRDGQARQKLYSLLVSRADRLTKAGDREGAYRVLMRALEVNPDGPEAHAALKPYTPTATPVPPTATPRPATGTGTGPSRPSTGSGSSGGGTTTGGGGTYTPPSNCPGGVCP